MECYSDRISQILNQVTLYILKQDATGIFPLTINIFYGI